MRLGAHSEPQSSLSRVTRRAFLAQIGCQGKALTPDDRHLCCQIVRPGTILAWFRKIAAAKYDSFTQRKKPVRPSKADEP